MYLENKIDRLFERYPKFFTGQNKTFLKSIARNESSINYKNLSYEFLLSDGKSHIFDFLKKYGTLYSLLENLLTKKTTVESANIEEVSFVTDLMHGYDESKLIDTTTIKDKSYFHNALLKNQTEFF